MIEFYGAGTRHGRKAAIMLEETDFPYKVRRVDLGAGAPHKPEFPYLARWHDALAARSAVQAGIKIPA